MKKLFSTNQKTINPDLPGIILLSHGPLSIALYETAKLIYGELDNFAAISLEEGDDLDKFSDEILVTLNMFPEGSLTMMDIVCGTPCNQLAWLCRNK